MRTTVFNSNLVTVPLKTATVRWNMSGRFYWLCNVLISLCIFGLMKFQFSEISLHMYIGLYLFLSDCNKTWNFSGRFSKKPQIQNFIKILSVGAELFHADRRTSMTKLTVAFRNFVNAPNRRELRGKNWRFCSWSAITDTFFLWI